ncbi:MAG TPA: S-adenosyl-l-methionine hydroxide adenosyltransferase family protein [Opitutaceae bacterium]|nr:S-adenosyl-l-methionine hydroxide adenosyltransferase family protein [Opitutaceae bacterium]
MIWFLALCATASLCLAGPLVLQTDFGTRDGAVAAMKGVAAGVDAQLPIHDLSHENTPYDTWEAAYRLRQTAPYWPAGTVFVSVVDPGVGTARKAIVLQTKSGHFFVSPDNGTLTLVAELLGVSAVREIDANIHRLPGSERSATFHGRDLFAYTGARLASGALAFADVGPELAGDLVRLPHEKARIEGETLVGGIPALDVRYGNVWTDIDETLFAALHPQLGERFNVTISRAGKPVFTGELPYVRTFGDVPEGQPLLYLNGLMCVSFALNLGSFAEAHAIACGADWSVHIERAPARQP